MSQTFAARNQIFAMAHTSKIHNEQSLMERLRRLPADKVRKVEGLVEHLSRQQEHEASRLEAAYKEMAADEAREQEALYWIEANVDDALDDPSREKHGKQR